MPKHHPKNERIKRKYLTYLEEAKRCSIKTTDQVAAAIACFEKYTKWKDFASFHIEQVKAFKRTLQKTVNPKTGKPLAKATIYSRLMHLKAFFLWLADQPGYKSRITYADCEYFNSTANDARVATAKRSKPIPTLEQLLHVIGQMPHNTLIEKRDRAILAFAALTGARDDAIASFSLKHLDLNARELFQDAREVRTKNRKTFKSWFFPVGQELEDIVADWVAALQTELLFGPDDPLFPSTKVGLTENRKFDALGLNRAHWSNANPIRKIFRQAFDAAGLPYSNPHLIRDMLTMLGEQVCQTPEEFKAWSMNLGHEHVATTLTSYGPMSDSKQASVMSRLRRRRRDGNRCSDVPDAETITRVLKHLSQQAS